MALVRFRAVIPLFICALCNGQSIITTLAGSRYTFPDDGLAALNAPVGFVTAVTADTRGNVYFADSTTDRVFKVDSNGSLSTAAGNGTSGYSGDSGPAIGAAISNPAGLAFDAGGNLYICDAGNNRIRKVSPAGVITTFAGNGLAGFAGDGGAAVAASLGNSTRLAIDASGNVYISDPDSHRVRRVTADGVIRTFAGNGVAGSSGDGGQALQASLQTPAGLALDSAGNLYLADQGANLVRKITPAGIITTIAGTGVGGNSGDDGPASRARINSPAAVAIDQNSVLYIAQQAGSRIRRVDQSGTITTIAGTGQVGMAGDGGPSSAASLYSPVDLFVTNRGALLIADFNNFRVRVISTGVISTLAGNGNFRYTGDGGVGTSATLPAPTGLAVDSNGNVNICDNFANRVRTVSAFGIINLTAGTNLPGYTGDGGPATRASLADCDAIALDANGNLYVADAANQRIRRISVSGIITTIAGNGQNGFTGDNVPAINTALSAPQGVTVDAQGNVYIADTGNNRIRKVSTTGSIITVGGNGDDGYSGDGGSSTAAQISSPTRVIVDRAGKIYFSDNGNNVVRAITPSFTIATVAGNGRYGFSGDGSAATSASLANPRGLALDSSGALLIADTDNHRIRKVDGSGNISTFAGNGSSTTSGDGRPPLSTGFGFPSDVAVDQAGNVYIADRNNSRVRRIQPAPSSIVLSETGITFTAAVDGASIPGNSLRVLNGGAGSFSWTATGRTISGGAAWLKLSPTQGTSTSAIVSSDVTVSVDPSGLSAGTYYGQIQISSPGVVNSPRFATVVLRVLAASQTAGPSLTPAGVVFTGAVGVGNPAAQAITISKLHGTALQFTGSLTFGEGVAWLTASPLSGSVAPNQAVRVALTPNVSGLAARVYTATLNLTFSDGSVRSVPATLALSTQSPSAQFETRAACSPTVLVPVLTGLGSAFSAPSGWPVPLEAKIVDDCGQSMTSGNVSATFSNGDPPLALSSLQDGTWSATWQPRAVANTTITLTARESQPPIAGTVKVSGQISTNVDPPVIDPGAILNAASFAVQGSVAPGTLVAVFGSGFAATTSVATALPLPTQLGGVQVIIGGIPMPLLFVGPRQINAMAPFDLATSNTQQVLVQSGTALSVPEGVAVAPVGPGAFTLDGSGTGAGIVVAVNADGSSHVVTPANPAHPGGVVVIYCAGLGGVQSTLEAGQAAPLSPLAPVTDAVSVTVGGVAAQVLFAGLTPTLSGLYQVNAIIPAGVTGDNIPLQVASIGNAAPIVTLAIH